jgi:hypothetical protein
MPIYEDVFENAQDETKSNDNANKSIDSEENDYRNEQSMFHHPYCNSVTNSYKEFEHTSDAEQPSTLNQTSAVPSQC